MPPVGFEPTIPARERQQIHALDRAATGTGMWVKRKHMCIAFWQQSMTYRVYSVTIIQIKNKTQMRY